MQPVGTLNQETIVLAIAATLFVLFAVTLDGFLPPGNVVSLVQNVSILGVLGIGMALTIIGRGIDLSMVANMAISVARVLYLANNGTPLTLAILYGLGLSLAIGLINGILIAYVEIPAIFATLAMGTAVYGFGQSMLVDSDVIFVPRTEDWFKAIGGSTVWGMPSPVLWLGAIGLVAVALLSLTRPGRFIYSMGDNPLAARVTGVPSGPMTVSVQALQQLIDEKPDMPRCVASCRTHRLAPLLPALPVRRESSCPRSSRTSPPHCRPGRVAPYQAEPAFLRRAATSPQARWPGESGSDAAASIGRIGARGLVARQQLG